MEILATRDTWWMAHCEAALSAERVVWEWIRPHRAAHATLDVPASSAERASQVLSEMLGEELDKRRDEANAPPSVGPLLLQPGFALGVCLALLTLAAHGWVGDVPSSWHERGALVTVLFWGGDWWRLVTAATLHADYAHALGNAGFFLVLAWAAGERFGLGVTVFLWLVTAVAGFVASLLLGDATWTVGASGGLFGLLGAAAGHATRHRAFAELKRRGLLRSLGGAVMLLAFTAFSVRANIPAHVGGFVAGVALGALTPRAAWRPSIQLGLAVATIGAVWWSWVQATGG